MDAATRAAKARSAARWDESRRGATSDNHASGSSAGGAAATPWSKVSSRSPVRPESSVAAII